MNDQGVPNYVVLLDANVPAPGEDWTTRSAIREDHKISIGTIRHAVRLYDITPRPSLGIQVVDLNPPWYLARVRGLLESNGVLVQTVTPGSAAEAAGIRPGDIITEFNGSRVDALRFAALVYYAPSDMAASIKLQRNGREMQTKATPSLLMTQKASALTPSAPAPTGVRVVVYDQSMPNAGAPQSVSTNSNKAFSDSLHLLNQSQDRVRDQMMHQRDFLMMEQARLSATMAANQVQQATNQANSRINQMNTQRATNQVINNFNRNQVDQARLDYLQSRHREQYSYVNNINNAPFEIAKPSPSPVTHAGSGAATGYPASGSRVPSPGANIATFVFTGPRGHTERADH
jgi:membrane-associated protease RseP (regulator of RpoE activity)